MKNITFNDAKTVYYVEVNHTCRQQIWENVAIDRVRFYRKIMLLEKLFIKTYKLSVNKNNSYDVMSK